MKKHYPYVESFKLCEDGSDDMYEASIAIPYISMTKSVYYHEQCMRIYGYQKELAERCKIVIDAFMIET